MTLVCPPLCPMTALPAILLAPCPNRLPRRAEGILGIGAGFDEVEGHASAQTGGAPSARQAIFPAPRPAWQVFRAAPGRRKRGALKRLRRRCARGAPGAQHLALTIGQNGLGGAWGPLRGEKLFRISHFAWCAFGAVTPATVVVPGRSCCWESGAEDF